VCYNNYSVKYILKERETVFNWYTKIEYCDLSKYDEYVKDIELEFAFNYSKYKQYRDIIQEALLMDNSKPLDTQDRIKTQLGETTLSDLATGLKAYIVLRVNIEQGNRVVVNVQEMGDNVAKAIMPYLSSQESVAICGNLFYSFDLDIQANMDSRVTVTNMEQYRGYICGD
jgi:hypothetical protein